MHFGRLILGFLIGLVGAIGLFDFARTFKPILWPTIRSLGQEQTTFFVVRFLGVTFEGWGIVLFEFGVLLVALALLGVGFYVPAIHFRGANYRAALDAGHAFSFHLWRHRPGARERER
jgi:hypothetical protein